jgi:hypothetical protein
MHLLTVFESIGILGFLFSFHSDFNARRLVVLDLLFDMYPAVEGYGRQPIQIA